MEIPEILSLVGTALAPVIFLFTFIYLRDKYRREPLLLLILNFVMGIVIAVPVVYVEIYMGKVLNTDTGGSLGTILLKAFIVVALAEEGFKFLALMLFAYPRKAFDEPYDGIVYATAVSLGFAAIENVMYTLEGGLGVGLLRAFTAVPGHAMMGVVMGYFVGLAKFSKGTGKSGLMLLTGLLAATIVHGLYDFFLMYDEVMLFPLAFVVLIVAAFLGLRAMKFHNRRSPFNTPEPPQA
jgi:RsiW-degrading membrane proteinase PrsW (M82 family)